ncbi:hypothetical protein FA13DRAFT_1740129 [Coprinellus micaceus]|uniref:Uncharacterized protein n=1 Tax=Coprinellus micaceus TaxID=71717 RepID=A0A4Y7SNK8_COPMI|nr:hypothetical protein FA13DRAFT_1740129 [Coprinellus micaceus]
MGSPTTRACHPLHSSSQPKEGGTQLNSENGIDTPGDRSPVEEHDSLMGGRHGLWGAMRQNYPCPWASVGWKVGCNSRQT